jgi:lipid II:glycine glycyltransferase (peptidoglycan interpeptide bridge formation enzyme)
VNVRDATPDELADWDRRTVEMAGGHVYQSRAWAAVRATSGWRPRFLVSGDGGRTLVLTRPWPAIGGGSAYLPRGPVPAGVGTRPGSVDLAERQVAIAAWLAGAGTDVVAADPEVPADDEPFRARITAAGFKPIEEIQPSRHRVTLPLGTGADEAAVFAGIAKSTRQRIRGAERDGIVVVRYDTRQATDGPGEEFAAPTAATSIALDRFYDLLLETGERLQFTFGPRSVFTGWWGAAHGAGHLVYLEAFAAGSADGRAPLAGLVLYRHGGRLSTVHSGDHAVTRTEHPGALHLLRWRAIQLAIREGCTEMDLGGADVQGARHEPRDGDAMYGLYQHKRAFGGRWLELTGAHERVIDARGYALGRLVAGLARVVRR